MCAGGGGLPFRPAVMSAAPIRRSSSSAPRTRCCSPTAHPLSPAFWPLLYPSLQCGGHQQLRRALELVAEMRSRGIEANIHTYSALMSVCVKCK